MLGEKFEMIYCFDCLKVYGCIDGMFLDFENWVGGVVYESFYFCVKDGVMEVEDGIEGYCVFFWDG